MAGLNKNQVWDAVTSTLPTLGRDFLLEIVAAEGMYASIKLTYLTETGRAVAPLMVKNTEDAIRRSLASIKDRVPLPPNIAPDLVVNSEIVDGILNPPKAPDQHETPLSSPKPLQVKSVEPPKPKPETQMELAQDKPTGTNAVPPVKDPPKQDPPNEHPAVESEPEKPEEPKTVEPLDVFWQQGYRMFASTSFADYKKWVAQILTAAVLKRLTDEKTVVISMPTHVDRSWLDSLKCVFIKLPPVPVDSLFGFTGFTKLVDSAYLHIRGANEVEKMYNGTLRAEIETGQIDSTKLYDSSVNCTVTMFYHGTKAAQEAETK